MILAYLPSPSQGVWHLGPLPIRAYALCIIAGIVVAIWWTQKRWSARGGAADDVLDIATRSSTSPAGNNPSGRSTSGTVDSGSGGRSRWARSGRGSRVAAAASDWLISLTH